MSNKDNSPTADRSIPEVSTAYDFMKTTGMIEEPRPEKIDINIVTGGVPWHELYKLKTVYVHKELLTIFEAEAKRMGKGGNAKIINEALKLYFKID